MSMTPYPLPEPATSAAQLHAVLDANLRLPPEYRDRLTNHLPMALHALHRLGASPQRMQDFYATYARRFQGMKMPATVAASGVERRDWQALRGQADAYPALRACFNDLVARQGIEATLHLTLPDLLPGVAAAAFHGLIRTAHAVESGHASELAAALAYWAWRWQAVPAPLVAPTLLGFDTWAARLVREAVGWRSEGPLISIRMDDASRSTVYQALAGALDPAATLEARIAELAALAVARYVASPNFTVLHLITGLRALRTLLPWLEQSGDGVQAILVHNFVAAYLAARVAPLDQPPVARPATWADVTEAAVESDDDHVIKLVDACRAEAAVYGETDYLRAAALATERSIT